MMIRSLKEPNTRRVAMFGGSGHDSICLANSSAKCQSQTRGLIKLRELIEVVGTDEGIRQDLQFRFKLCNDII